MGIACLRNRNNERTCLGMCGIAGEGESVKQSKMAVYAWDLRHTCLYQKALETLFFNKTKKEQKPKETQCQQGFCLAIFGITYLFFYLKTSSNFSVVLRFVKPVNSNKVRFLFLPWPSLSKSFARWFKVPSGLGEPLQNVFATVFN